MSHCEYTTTTGEKLQALDDPKFPWRDKKSKTYRLARLYDLAGFPRYGDRVAACASWLEYAVKPNPEDICAEPVRALTSARFCDLRLCPMCNARKAKRASILLRRVLEEGYRQFHCQYVFLTLSLRNVSGPELGDAIKALTKAWDRLQNQRPVQRAFLGWFRAIEITRNAENGSYHPHIHAILMPRYNYFKRKAGLYLTHSEWLRRWQEAAEVDYPPDVDIRAAYAKTKNGKRKSREQAAAEEAAKYATKDAEFIGAGVPEALAAEIVRTYTVALKRKRLTAFGGVLKLIAKALEADNLEEGDLVHLPDDDGMGDATALEWYRWHLGVNDYILDRVIFAPGGDCD